LLQAYLIAQIKKNCNHQRFPGFFI